MAWPTLPYVPVLEMGPDYLKNRMKEYRKLLKIRERYLLRQNPQPTKKAA